MLSAAILVLTTYLCIFFLHATSMEQSNLRSHCLLIQQQTRQQKNVSHIVICFRIILPFPGLGNFYSLTFLRHVALLGLV